MRLKHPFVIGFGALAAIGLTVALWPRPLAVETQVVSRGPMRVTLDEQGQTRARVRYVISAPVGGQLERVLLEPGDRVRKGQAVATIVPATPALLDARTAAEARSAVGAAQAALSAARSERERLAAALRYATSQTQRLSDLYAAGGVSRDSFEAAQSQQRSAREALRAAEANEARAAHQLDSARAAVTPGGSRGPAQVLRAPIDGVVLTRQHESAAVVGPGEPVLTIGDPGALEVVADYLSTEAVGIRPGQAAAISNWGGDGELTGRVERVEPGSFTKVSALGVEEQRVNVVIALDPLPESARTLGDAYRVEAHVVVWQSDSALIAPASALFRHGTDWAAYAVAGGKARLRALTIGHRNAQQVEVLSGLTEGDALVVYPPDTLKDGMAVKATPAGEGSPVPR